MIGKFDRCCLARNGDGALKENGRRTVARQGHAEPLGDFQDEWAFVTGPCGNLFPAKPLCDGKGRLRTGFGNRRWFFPILD